ncbi:MULTISPECIES: MarR family transcriptional regulator [unclassified Pseudodesulfovibrio]|uniref:MarR family winged helix-turn-helix transcriptional regulator n=1 Tax=unclassified Pseudodesulfovibrio TaxID=2661612 RepID=UPI000FEC20B5|nr:MULTISPECIES: MarR family transcriptional regulator [unclassified Pseudodesulfovibrio]MCJ2164340.1 MarR family transcriptional regulator [Pseudodesulfovibrio sp. S3-i]RWU04550.1 MarR family transcriptional regulator [Pseudodesulfovibrio sp. S3]
MQNTSLYLQNCLYFTANALARNITRMAERAFKDTDLSPSHAFAIMLVNELPGITIKELSEHLHLAHSTMVRFTDKLVYLDLVERKQDKRVVRVYPTDKAREMQKDIKTAWTRLHEDYSKILGREQGDELTRTIFKANQRIEDLA